MLVKIRFSIQLDDPLGKRGMLKKTWVEVVRKDMKK